ncbi:MULTISPECIES: MFS transporter [Corynebacterium]|uniref:MFS family major facilitator transporter n=2 Tax=Corynebacterium TaxID=1716 RepID=A0ABN4F3H0_9CORY|nr:MULTISPECIES: MFS transporter [Corynebacterium]AEG82632.1 putative membrane protein [Corynebacterium ulcerans 809]AIT90150.1 MFS family major facilitator transporter [Corynebacterium ulcerans]AIU33672.1 MFS family major facilitator transporter [Corynebacterium ramonii FRC0011]AKA97646.1 MFS family major facilitator transporter [Corynebacterium ulcerans]AKN78123.1 MFS family major facilitator transporter [Corynebacterium ulcerans FRC58]
MPSSASVSADRLTRNDRLDRLPFTPKHRRLLWGSGIGWALDAMDVGLISFIMAALVAHWGLSHTQTSWLASAGFIGMAIGATLGGLLADRFGRRHIFAITLLIYGLATGASALSMSLGVLIIFRFIVGLGLGAELPVASTLVSEFSPRVIRGRMVVALEAFWALGWIAAACIGAFVISGSSNGWRWALALGCIPALYSLYVRLGLPESVRFLEAKGRHQEAEQVVRSFEQSAEADGCDVSKLTTLSPTEREDDAGENQGIFSGMYRKRTIALWVIWFCINLSYYGAFIWIPSLLVSSGFPLVKSFEFTLIITLAQLPGYAVSAWLIEKWGRRSTLVFFLIGSACAAGFYSVSSTETMIIMAGCCLSFFNLGAWGALYAIGPELYPSRMRGAGTGAAAGFGRIASIIAPLIVPPVVAIGGTMALFGLFGAAFAIAAAATLLLPEQKGKALT